MHKYMAEFANGASFQITANSLAQAYRIAFYDLAEIDRNVELVRIDEVVPADEIQVD